MFFLQSLVFHSYVFSQEAQILNEKHALEKRIAYMRMVNVLFMTHQLPPWSLLKKTPWSA
jgi:hypothetical protein